MKDRDPERNRRDFDPERQGKPREDGLDTSRDPTKHGKPHHENDPERQEPRHAERRAPRDEDEIDDEDTAPGTSRRYNDPKEYDPDV